MTPARLKHMRQIVQTIAAEHGLTKADIYVRDRSRPIVAARHEVWSSLRALGYTLQSIADLAGWDHTSVMHGVCKVCKV